CVSREAPETAEQTDRVRLQDRGRHIEGDRQNRPSGVTPDPGQTQSSLKIARKHSAVFGDDYLRRAVKLPRSAIVAETFPKPENLLLVRVGECRDGRQGSQETLEIRDDSRDLRLLEHDLAQPDV